MAIFNSYVSLPEGNRNWQTSIFSDGLKPLPHASGDFRRSASGGPRTMWAVATPRLVDGCWGILLGTSRNYNGEYQNPWAGKSYEPMKQLASRDDTGFWTLPLCCGVFVEVISLADGLRFGSNLGAPFEFRFPDSKLGMCNDRRGRGPRIKRFHPLSLLSHVEPFGVARS